MLMLKILFHFNSEVKTMPKNSQMSACCMPSARKSSAYLLTNGVFYETFSISKYRRYSIDEQPSYVSRSSRRCLFVSGGKRIY